MAALAAADPEADEATVEAAATAQAEAEEAAAAVGDFLAALAEAEAAKAAEAATVTVSADGTQMQIKDASGNTATSITSDTGVLITMDLEPIQQALDNLSAGGTQGVVTTTGAELTGVTGADGTIKFYDSDGEEALKADGSPYDSDDLIGLNIKFGG